jgi:mannose-1-phosphate guanylyltransferase/mannose-6-phosphate isomerase
LQSIERNQKKGNLMDKTVIPVILCGGSGTRLWPASREYQPKQFLQLIDDFSLLQNTMRRALRISGAAAKNIVTVTGDALAAQVRAQLGAIDPAATEHVLSEPSARNTAAAVAYAAAYIEHVFGKDALMWILPADHHIGDEDEMSAAFQHALHAGGSGHLVTFGIRPTRPETGYGYIRLGKPLQGSAVYHADSFVEKPDAETASGYVEAGNYLWNSGMFLFSTDILLAEYERLAPAILEKARLAMNNAGDKRQALDAHYGDIPEVPFDKAIMEKSAGVAVIPCNPAWSDIGSWESLWEISPKDLDGNVIEGNAVCHSTKDCLIRAQKRLIACAGLENLVIVETGDALLIANRSDGDSMRMLVKALKGAGYAETTHPAAINLNNPAAGAKIAVGAA